MKIHGRVSRRTERFWLGDRRIVMVRLNHPWWKEMYFGGDITESAYGFINGPFGTVRSVNREEAQMYLSGAASPSHKESEYHNY